MISPFARGIDARSARLGVIITMRYFARHIWSEYDDQDVVCRIFGEPERG